MLQEQRWIKQAYSKATSCWVVRSPSLWIAAAAATSKIESNYWWARSCWLVHHDRVYSWCYTEGLVASHVIIINKTGAEKKSAMEEKAFLRRRSIDRAHMKGMAIICGSGSDVRTAPGAVNLARLVASFLSSSSMPLSHGRSAACKKQSCSDLGFLKPFACDV